MKFETKAKKLGILEECESIIANCECGIITSARLEELPKMRKWEIMDIIGNYLDSDKLDFDVRFSTFLKTYDLEESEVSEVYAKAISEFGCEIAYAINKDVVLILE